MRDLRTAHIGWLSDANGAGYKTVAWCNIDEKRLAAARARHRHVATYTDYRELLRHEKLDAVYIATPNYVHAEQAIAFLDAGVHVFLEKPMGVNKAETDAILRAATRNQRLCVIDFEMRVSLLAVRLREMVDAGAYGGLKRLEVVHHRGCWQEEGNGIWRTRPEKSGGLYFMEPIHAVDLFRFLGGEIMAVQSVAGPNVLPQYRFEDNVCSHFFFASGALGTLLTTHTLSAYSADPKCHTRAKGHNMDLVVTFERGAVGVDMIACRMVINRFVEYPAGTGAYRVEFERIEDYADVGCGAFIHDISAMRREFVRRLIAGENPVVTTLDAWKTHQVCLAAEQSVREDGRRVAVDFALPAGVGER